MRRSIVSRERTSRELIVWIMLACFVIGALVGCGSITNPQTPHPAPPSYPRS